MRVCLWCVGGGCDLLVVVVNVSVWCVLVVVVNVCGVCWWWL